MLSTVSGDLVADSLVGDLALNGVSGEFSVRDHDGRVTAQTVSGAVTVSGRVSDFSSDGVSANVFLEIAGAPRKILVNTVSGSVTAPARRRHPRRVRDHDRERAAAARRHRPSGRSAAGTPASAAPPTAARCRSG